MSYANRISFPREGTRHVFRVVGMMDLYFVEAEFFDMLGGVSYFKETKDYGDGLDWAIFTRDPGTAMKFQTKEQAEAQIEALLIAEALEALSL
jgi:hypothetical protein